MNKRKYLLKKIEEQVIKVNGNIRFQKRIIILVKNKLIAKGYIENNLDQELDLDFELILYCYDLEKVVREVYKIATERMVEDYKLLCKALNVSFNKDTSLYYYLN